MAVTVVVQNWLTRGALVCLLMEPGAWPVFAQAVTPGDAVADSADGSIPPPDTYVPFDTAPQPLPDACPQPTFPDTARRAAVEGQVEMRV